MERQKGSELVRAEFQYTRAEYVRGVQFYLRKSYLISWIQVLVVVLALAAAVAIAVMLHRMTFLNTFVLVLLVLVSGYGVFLYFIQPGRLFDKTPGLAQKMIYVFSPEDIARQDDEAGIIFDWNIKKLWKSKEFYYLFLAKDGYIMIPRRAFRSEQDQKRFEELAQVANADLVIKTYG